MTGNLNNSSIPVNEAKIILRSAHQRFKLKDYVSCLKILYPVLENNDKIEDDQKNILSLMWGMAGDCLVSLESIDDAISSYRKSIEINPYSDCILPYASTVVEYGLNEEAQNAYQCVVEYEQSIKSIPKYRQVFNLLVRMIFIPESFLKPSLLTLAKQTKSELMKMI